MAGNPATIVRLDGVGLRYPSGVEALREVHLTLQAGSFHFLLGQSGAGKTSLLRLISLARPATSGALTLFGRDAAKLDRAAIAAVRRRIGIVHEDHRLLDHLSAFENVMVPLRLAEADESSSADVVTSLLSWLGLVELVGARPPELSLGQRQLVAVARAAVTRPALLLADEPTASVDPERARRVMHLLLSLHRLGTTVILATHSYDLARRYPFPALSLQAGRVGELAPLQLAAE